MNMLITPSATTIALSRISKGDNPRRYFDSAKHDELVASIRLRGVLQPILVRPAQDGSDGFTIIAGERRYRAAITVYGEAGEIPAVIRHMTDQEACEAAIDENDVRDDASETEQADAAVRVLKACDNDPAEASRRLGWSRAKFDRRLALANLSTAAKTALDERRIKVGHAELLAAVHPDNQDKALATIVNAKLDVAKTRDLLQQMTQQLAHATFSLADCVSCPFNSATQRALFDTHVDDGQCTNAVCFKLKTEAASEAALLAQTAAAEADRLQPTATLGNEASEGDDDEVDDDNVDDTDGDADDGENQIETDNDSGAGPSEPTTRPAAPSLLPSATTAIAPKPTTTAATPVRNSVTASSLANRTSDLRETSWRTAVARALASKPDNAKIAILTAAMSGTLSQIKAHTLTRRAGVVIGEAFPDLSFSSKLSAIADLDPGRSDTAFAVIGAAYALDVATFGNVADLARTFAVDLRDTWCVDKSFLERYTKDELKFIARECGLIAHIGDRQFAKLFGSKKPDLIAGMLNAIGFEWSGHLPSAMTLNAQYAPPHYAADIAPVAPPIALAA